MAGRRYVYFFKSVKVILLQSARRNVARLQETGEAPSEVVENGAEAEALEPESGLTKQVEEEQVQATEFEEFEGMYNKAMQGQSKGGSHEFSVGV